MIIEKVALSANFPALAASGAFLEVYAPSPSPELGENRRYPSVLICPGGGYGMTSDREAEPVALAFVGRGMAAFVLRYSVNPAEYPLVLLEAAAAMAYIRQNAARFGVEEDALFVMGFSAGGHLAGTLGTHWNREVLAPLGLPAEVFRPSGLVLCYGVLSFGATGHAGSVRALLGENPSEEQILDLSFEHAAGPHVPPTFLWHSCTDTVVPVENSLYAAVALAKANVPFELHVHPEGAHGLSLATWVTTEQYQQGIPPRYLSGWVNDCADWILRQAGRL